MLNFCMRLSVVSFAGQRKRDGRLKQQTGLPRCRLARVDVCTLVPALLPACSMLKEIADLREYTSNSQA